MAKAKPAPRVRVIETERLVNDPFLRVDRTKIKYKLPDGAWSEEQPRFNVDRGNSVAALLHDATTRQLHFVRQFRFSSYDPADEPAPDNGWMLELIAGAVKRNEEMRESIVREIDEETGFTATKQPELIGSFFLTPGASSERLFLFYVVIDSSVQRSAERGQNMRGAATEDERIETVAMSPSDFLSLVEQCRIVDAKTVAAAEFVRRRPDLFD